jgi:hypothetical protein
LLLSGLPKLLEYFQNKADQAHELKLAQVQTERELQLAAAGFAAQARMEEIRTEQVAMETDARMTEAALAHDQKIMDKASRWVVNYTGTVRPTVTYIFVFELVAINAFILYSDLIFSADEMAILGGIIGYWFGSRQWSKK